MNVQCSACQSVFRIDPAKVPEVGIRARCNVCGAVIAVGHASAPRPELAMVATAPSPDPATPEPPQAPEIAGGAPNMPAVAMEPVGGDSSTPSRSGDAAASQPAAPAPSVGTEPRQRPVNPYLNNTPELRARRLARALVSDLVAYNPQKREEGLRDGTLRQLFREEIRKSWDEYVEQVGASVAESTPHFQDALNDVLAGGRRVF